MQLICRGKMQRYPFLWLFLISIWRIRSEISANHKMHRRENIDKSHELESLCGCNCNELSTQYEMSLHPVNLMFKLKLNTVHFFFKAFACFSIGWQQMTLNTRLSVTNQITLIFIQIAGDHKTWDSQYGGPVD